jgi:hypothetical protein
MSSLPSWERGLKQQARTTREIMERFPGTMERTARNWRARAQREPVVESDPAAERKAEWARMMGAEIPSGNNGHHQEEGEHVVN